MAGKAPEAFRTISEAAAEVGVAQHVLRFWETRFNTVRPLKRTGGRRFYRPQDIAILQEIRDLLHGQGLSIRDVQALHSQKPRSVQASAPSGPRRGRPSDDNDALA
ncbi:MAG: MerR family transcriptional regulator, partial [Caulobacteraceae bacterium]|nr:MerR family transcriptional regulator [Caulobacteraceae bacterium]